ncbi:Hypothetical protein AA314_04700 [Archangium gephyra]|uniref:Uncharacterized protein n=1 Tax=Archangium gephyra TaxID=48 RepID=A0AAC8Q947_9BACT|nr:Hypothetical protein AA314_04700 [Archangium gephyra]
MAELRVVADYLGDELTVELVRRALEKATAFVQRLLGEEPIW